MELAGGLCGAVFRKHLGCWNVNCVRDATGCFHGWRWPVLDDLDGAIGGDFLDTLVAEHVVRVEDVLKISLVRSICLITVGLDLSALLLPLCKITIQDAHVGVTIGLEHEGSTGGKPAFSSFVDYDCL